jgi:hypothetical protein
MIGCKQIKPEIAISSSVEIEIAVFQQLWQPIFEGIWLPPFVMFDGKNVTKCYGYSKTGSFTAKIYINSVHAFTVTDGDSINPVGLVSGDGALLVPDILTCEITSCTGTVQGLYIQVQ